jgi:hypothetical protein
LWRCNFLRTENNSLFYNFHLNREAANYSNIIYESIFWLTIIYLCLITTAIADFWHLPNGDTIHCWPYARRLPPKITNIADCDAAISMIPSGLLAASDVRWGHPTKPISLLMSHNGGRGLRLPAAFIAGSCTITVQALTVEHAPPRPPPKAATAMFFQIWPKAVAAARTITHICMPPDKMPAQIKYEYGAIVTRSILDGWQFMFSVRVRGSPVTLPEPSSIDVSDRVDHLNLYFSTRVPWVDKIRTKRLREEHENLAPSEGFVDAPPQGNRSSRRKPNNRYGEDFLS